ncbi:hypothetical protein THAOC_14645, partial [Thalassiosira oceanica]
CRQAAAQLALRINHINVYVSNGTSRRRGGASRNGRKWSEQLGSSLAPAVRANEAEATPVRSPLDTARGSVDSTEARPTLNFAASAGHLVRNGEDNVPAATPETA